MSLITFILVCLLILVVSILIVGALLSQTGYKGPKSDHFDGKRFLNPSGRTTRGLTQVFKYLKSRTPDAWVLQNHQTIKRRDFSAIIESGKCQITFINHSSFLVQMKNFNFLTDPVFSERCSPFQFSGPKRVRPPGIHFEDLPDIQMVLISHNHYDHLDKRTILKLDELYSPLFVVPLGVDHLLKKWQCKNIITLDWWDKHRFNELEITSIPANHFSARGMFDRDKTLWCGYQIKYDDVSFYFAGDTGYSDVFKEIGSKLNQPDISLIPIGAYKPEWFMSPVHISPEEAVKVHLDIMSKKSIAMHFGTFPLADDNRERGLSELNVAKQNHGLKDDEFIILSEGQTLSVSK